MIDLYRRSIEIILQNQAPSGAYIASPNFPSYRYCWFRDGAFTAYAMDLVHETESAASFHAWAARAILKRRDLVRQAASKVQDGQPLNSEVQLHARYTLDGDDGTREEWPNYQLDGLGTWLWALGEHLCITGQPLADEWLQAARLVAEYLEALWRTTCYDCWEEFPNDIHSHTLAAIYGGLHSLSDLDGIDRSNTLHEIQGFLSQNSIYDGYFVKMVGSYTVDASLLGLAVPYSLVEVDDPRFNETLKRIETSLVKGGGVHRYPTDTYFGGGEWILLAGWLGWVYTRRGESSRALDMLRWIERQADQDGNLPEQVPSTLNDPNYYKPWVRKSGPIANPLLWSHAEYLILRTSLS